MTPEGIYQLQNLDCNCNNCKFMVRDEIEFNLWKGYTEHLQYVQFLRARHVILRAVGNCVEENNKNGYKALNSSATKLKFQFDKTQLTIHYGFCIGRKGKFNQPVTFMPDAFQFDTQECFENRRQV